MISGNEKIFSELKESRPELVAELVKLINFSPDCVAGQCKFVLWFGSLVRRYAGASYAGTPLVVGHPEIALSRVAAASCGSRGKSGA